MMTSSFETTQASKKITTFQSWMEAWNIYLAILVDHVPTHAPSLIVYLRIITSASSHHPPSAWLNYTVWFHTLAAANPLLRWDICKNELWLEFFSGSASALARWPCGYCGATTHYPDNCLFCPLPIPVQNPEQHPHYWASFNRPARWHYSQSTSKPPTSKAKPVIHLIAPTADTFFHICAPATVPGSAPTRAVPLIKLKPWTLLQPFILKRELSKHPNKAFVKLIEHLCCFIGYKGPQFSYHANNLVSAYQQPEVIDATLKKKCQLGRILGPFQTPPLPNFQTSGLRLVPKHDGGWTIIYYLSVPLYISINHFIDPDDYSLPYCTIDDAHDFIN